MFDEAMKLAKTVHADQTDKAGQPYLAHVERVAHAVRHRGEEVRTAAVLHDVLEDSDVTAADLLRLGFRDYTVDLVLALTHRRGWGESNPDYWNRIREFGEDAVAIKRADVVDNLRRIAYLDDRPTRLRLYGKYTRALQHLAAPMT